MKTAFFLTAIFGMLFCSVPLLAHDVPNMKHSHAFQQKAYGKYRQGHYVNGPQGSIIVWSARPYTGYNNGSAVKFARPTPITKAPSVPKAKSILKNNPAITYGKKPRKD